MLVTFQNLDVAVFRHFPCKNCILQKCIRYLSTATLQEYSVIKGIKLLHKFEIHM